MSKSNKTVKDPSRIHNLKGLIKNSQTNAQIKHRKSENFRKIKMSAHKSGHSKGSHILEGNTVPSIPEFKGQQQIFGSTKTNFIYKPSQEEPFSAKTGEIFSSLIDSCFCNLIISIAGSGGTEGMYRLTGNLVQKIPTTKDIQSSKISKAFINKNKKILKNAFNNGEYLNQPRQRRLSNIAKSSKAKKYKNPKSSYYVSKDKIIKTYKESTITSHSNYTNEPVKGHKRSSSDSQKLYDINNWKASLNPPFDKAKCNTNENTSRFRKKIRKTYSKERAKNSKSTNHEKSVEKASIHIDKYYNLNKQNENADPMLVTPRSFHIGGQHSSKHQMSKL